MHGHQVWELLLHLGLRQPTFFRGLFEEVCVGSSSTCCCKCEPLVPKAPEPISGFTDGDLQCYCSPAAGWVLARAMVALWCGSGSSCVKVPLGSLFPSPAAQAQALCDDGHVQEYGSTQLYAT